MAANLRLFVAVDIDEHVRQQVAHVENALRPSAPGAKWVNPTLCHVTLKFLGYVEGEQMAGIAAACREAATAAQPFDLSCEGLGVFPRWRAARVLWIGLHDGAPVLAKLQSALEHTLSPLGFELDDRPFSPHLTLARFKQPPGHELESAARKFEQRTFGRVRVQELRLMRSDLHPSEPIYTPLEAFALG